MGCSKSRESVQIRIEEEYSNLNLPPVDEKRFGNSFEKEVYMAVCVFRADPAALERFVPSISKHPKYKGHCLQGVRRRFRALSPLPPIALREDASEVCLRKATDSEELDCSKMKGGGMLKALQKRLGKGVVVDATEHTEYSWQGNGFEYVMIKLTENCGGAKKDGYCHPLYDPAVKEFGICFRPHKKLLSILQILWIRDVKTALV